MQENYWNNWREKIFKEDFSGKIVHDSISKDEIDILVQYYGNT